ncbi:MAG: hypothetical protein K9N06_12565 [Candidatus Cloacimonetes bacterium]|nr:hypothetical protein [Candidatus Cloacimonadota bacterium]
MEYEHIILKDIYESINGLYSFYFYSKYRIQPNQLFKFIDKYSKKGFILYEDNRITITDKGRNEFLTKKIVISTNGNKFSKIPEEFLIKQLDVNEPYIPNINEVPDEIMKS